MRNHRHRTVVVAVIAVRTMQAAVHEIVDMIAMRHGFVAAIRPVAMRRFVAGCVMLRIAAVRIPVAYGNHMLLGAAALGMLKSAVGDIIDVAFMPHGKMAASGAVNVRRSLAGTALFKCHGGSSIPHPQSSLQNMPKGHGGKEDISTLQ